MVKKTEDDVICIGADTVVELVYEIRDANGRILDERNPNQPLLYLHGRGTLLPLVEETLDGKTEGFIKKLCISCSDAYGDHRPDLVAEISRASLPAELEIQKGMKFNTRGPEGQNLPVQVVEVSGSTVKVDGNHPLSGLDLEFHLRVLQVRRASSQEIQSGEVQSQTHLH